MADFYKEFDLSQLEGSEDLLRQLLRKAGCEQQYSVFEGGRVVLSSPGFSVLDLPKVDETIRYEVPDDPASPVKYSS